MAELSSLLVEITGAPNTALLGGDDESEYNINGRIGHVSWFDQQAGKYAVQLLDDEQYVLVQSDHMRPWDPPSCESGGFDFFWGGDQLSLQDLGNQVMDKLAGQGWCLLECPRMAETRKAAVTQAKKMEGYYTPKPELVADYMGKGGVGKVCFLEHPDLNPDPDSMLEDGSSPEGDVLATFEDGMDLLCQEIAKYTPDVFGFNSIGRRRVLAWLPYANRSEMSRLRPEPISEDDVENGVVGEHLNFIRHRKVGLLWMVDNQGGELQLIPSADYEDLETVKLPVTANKLLIYRADLMTYSYKPKLLTESLVLQTWLLEEPPKLTSISLVGDSDTISLAQGIDIGLPLPVGRRMNVTSMHGKLPSVHRHEDFLYLLGAGTDVFIKFPVTRFDSDLYCCSFEDFAPGNFKSYVIHSSMMPDEDVFNIDYEFFGLEAHECQYMSPSHRLVLEVAYNALYRNGYTKKTMKGANIGLYCGDTGSDFTGVTNAQRLFLNPVTDSHGQQVSPLSHLSYCGGSQCITANRFHYCMGLVGPASQVDTACSASLITFVMAAGDMREETQEQGTVNICRHTSQSLCGGVSVQVGPGSFAGLCAGTMLSKDGRCKTFNQTANGYARGEACSFGLMEYGESEEMNLKRLACLVGLAANQDGRSANLTAPSGPAQQACIRQSMREAGLHAKQICVSECHGTGTALGDPIEVGALRGVMEPRDTTLGSTSSKSHVGHMEACAGVVGVWKCIVMMECSLGTPNVHLGELNGHLDVHGYPVWFHNEFYNTNMNAGVSGVSSFGFGGTNGRSDIYGQCRKGPMRTGDDYIDPNRKGLKRTLFKVQCPVTMGNIDYLTGEPIETLMHDKTYFRADVLREPMAPYDVSRHAYLGGYRYQAREPADYGEADLLPGTKLYICGSWTGYQRFEEMERLRGGWYATSMALGETRHENFFLCLNKDREQRIYPAVKNATPFINVKGPDADPHNADKTWRIDGRDLQVPQGTTYKIAFKWGILHKEIRWEEDDWVKKEEDEPYSHTYFVAASFTSWSPQVMKKVPDLENTWEVTGRFGITGSEEFKFLRDADWEQSVYPAKITNRMGVPVRGPDDLGKNKYWTLEGDSQDEIRLRLTVIDGRVTVESQVGFNPSKVWESAMGWDRHQYYVIGEWNDYYPIPMLLDHEKPGVFRTRVRLGNSHNKTFDDFQIWIDDDQFLALYPSDQSYGELRAPVGKYITLGPDGGGIQPRKTWCITTQGERVFEIQLDFSTADRRRIVTWFPVEQVKPALEAFD